MKLFLQRNNNLNILLRLNKTITTSTRINKNLTSSSSTSFSSFSSSSFNKNKEFSFITLRNHFNVLENNFQSFFNRLFSIPKGFRKYYPENNGSGTSTSSTPSSTTNKGSIPNEVPKSTESVAKGDKTSQSSDPIKDNVFKSKTKSNKGSGRGTGMKDDDPTPIIGPMVFIVTLVGGLLFLADGKSSGREISWQEFQHNYLDKGLVKKISIANKSIARVELKRPGAENPWNETNSMLGDGKEFDQSHFQDQIDQSQRYPPKAPNHIEPTAPGGSLQVPPQRENIYFTIGSVDSFERKMDDAQARLHEKSFEQVEVVYQSEHQYLKIFIEVLPTFFLIGMMYYLLKGMSGSGGGGPMGNIFKIGKSTANMVKKEDMKVTFKDVAGCDEAKKEVMEFVEFLKSPEKFKALGAKIPRGALLAGPPGTGKTLLAKATAGEANVPFFSISGSDFVEMFVGVGASRVRDLFKEARAHAPCIIFIDEIDAVGRARGKGGVGGHDERENTLNQLLIEMDGFNTDQSVIMLAGTNRADMLDSALTRPGRFDRTIAVELPDIKGRKSIFDVHLKNIKLNGTVEEYSPRLAALTPGFSGADIANICNEAAIHAGRRNKKFVELEDFESATDRIIGGLESTKIISPEEKRIVAFHEAGHAVAGWYLEHANPLLKVTIVPRSKGSLGYAQYLPKEISLRTKEQVMDLVCMALAGRASELVHFGKYTTGASDDLNKVTQIIYQLVQVYGMNDKVGQLAFPQREGQWPQERAYSESTAQLMDEEVRDLADKAFKRTVELMEQYKEDVTRVAELLIQQETIDHSDIARLIGERKFSAGKEYDEFVATKKKIEVETTTTSTNEEKSSNESSSEGGVQVGLA